jgi:hypothetical protein
VTYPYLHLACGLPELKRCVRAALADRLSTVTPLPGADTSQLRWHPTAWDYVRAANRDHVR